MKRKKVQRSCNKEAAFVGAMIYALIIGFLDEKEQMRGTTIRLKQTLLGQLRKCDNGMAKKADEAFKRVLDDVEGKGYSMYVSTVIETLFFNSENKMKAMYSNDINDIVSNFAIKLETYDNDDETARNSYLVADMLSKEFKKEAI